MPGLAGLIFIVGLVLTASLKSGAIGRGIGPGFAEAAAASDTTAIYALAETSDPRVLAQLHVRGMQGDPAKARTLYEQARAKGVTKAQE